MKMTKPLKDILKNDEILKEYKDVRVFSFNEISEDNTLIPKEMGVYIFFDKKMIEDLLYCGETVVGMRKRFKKHIAYGHDPEKFHKDSIKKMYRGIMRHKNEKQHESGYAESMYMYVNKNMKDIGVAFIVVDGEEETENLEKCFIGKYSMNLYFNNKDRHFNVSESRHCVEVERHYEKALSFISNRNSEKMILDVIDGMEMEGGKKNNMFEIRDIKSAKKNGFKIIIGKMCTRTHDNKLRRMVVITDEKLRERLANKNIVSIDGVRNKDYAFCDECNVKKLKEFTKANKKKSPAYMNVGIQLDYERKNGTLGLKSLNIS